MLITPPKISRIFIARVSFFTNYWHASVSYIYSCTLVYTIVTPSIKQKRGAMKPECCVVTSSPDAHVHVHDCHKMPHFPFLVSRAYACTLHRQCRNKHTTTVYSDVHVHVKKKTCARTCTCTVSSPWMERGLFTCALRWKLNESKVQHSVLPESDTAYQYDKSKSRHSLNNCSAPTSGSG